MTHFLKKLVNLFGKEIKSTIKILGSILIIIIIHSILKSISDGLENKSISTIIILCAIHINSNTNNE